jgi:hypothetical protein
LTLLRLNCEIEADGMKIFAKASHKFSKLKELNLHASKIGPEGMKYFAKSAKNFP